MTVNNTVALAFLIMELNNAKEWPKRKTAKFLTQGLVSYIDSGAGIALLKNETIHAALETFVGKPVIIEHSEVTPGNYEKYRKGNIIGTSFNSTDGWFYVDFLVDDDEAIKCIEEHGYSVSCAYNVLDVAVGGTYQDIPYDGEITKISFTHLALVKVPRYEESRILDEMPAMMLNGKVQAKTINKQEANEMLSIFKKNKEGQKEEITPLVLINGKEIPLNELLAAVENAKENAKEKYMAKDEDVVDVNGNTITIADLKKNYLDVQNKKNSAEEKKDEQEKEVEKEKAKEDKPEGAQEEEVKRAKENEKETEEEKKMEEKKNAKEQGDKFFAELQNASAKASEFDFTKEQPASGLTRVERAAKWAAKVKKD